jgi:ABC-type transport system involved in multi-copper enzyme maturation permease subunit
VNIPALPFQHLRERANPVLVRELRQAFRGKQFRIVFALSSTYGLVASWIAIAASDDPTQVGQGLFIALSVALSIACLVLVPVGAFQSLASEWEEGTWDLLELTDLRPRRIVWGKLQTAGVQCLLYFVGMAPFLVFCFVLRGVGPLLILMLMGHLLIGSLAATAVAIALSSLSRQRVLRGILLGLFVIFLVQIGGGLASLLIGASVIRAGGMAFGTGAGWIAAAGYATGMFMLTAVAYSAACARLSHPEENRSTPLRIVASCGVALHLCWLALMQGATSTSSVDVGVSLSVGAVFVALFGALFASEHEAFGRRTRLQVPAHPLRARFAAPWLPGGARGYLWLVLHLGVLVLAAPLLLARGSSYFGAVATLVGGTVGAWIPGFSDGSVFSADWRAAHPRTLTEPLSACVTVVICACYMLFYVGTTTSLLALIRSKSLPLRVLRAFAPLFLFVATALVPGLLGLLLSDGELMSLMHPFNPIAVIGGVFTSSTAEHWKWYPIVLGGFGLALSAPRCRRALMEVANASARRREREASPVEALVAAR